MARNFTPVVFAVLMVGCSAPVPGGGAVDSGQDAGLADAGAPDSGVSDSGFVDSGLVDSGVLDAGSADAGPPDAGPPDAGSPDAGAGDAGPADAGLDAGTPIPGSRFWDGGSCAVKTDCPCFSSDDCAPTFFCHSENASGSDIYCVPGARGDGGLGATCTGEADCSSALCLENGSASRCTVVCDTVADCGGDLPKCLYVGFGVDRSICAP